MHEQIITGNNQFRAGASGCHMSHVTGYRLSDHYQYQNKKNKTFLVTVSCKCQLIGAVIGSFVNEHDDDERP
jgi:hypothetical protein